MKRKSAICAIGAAAILGMTAGTTIAADSGGNTNSKTQSSVARQEGVPEQSTGDAATWERGYAAQHNGRISRDAYMEEMGRRWDALDRNRQGLTPSEVSRLTGHVDSSAPPALTGSGVQAGNMGPGNSKAQ